METQAFKHKEEKPEKTREGGKKEETLEERIYNLGRKTTDPKETMSRIPTKPVQEAIIKTGTIIEAIDSTARLSKRLDITNIHTNGKVMLNLLTAIEDIVPKRA